MSAPTTPDVAALVARIREWDAPKSDGLDGHRRSVLTVLNTNALADALTRLAAERDALRVWVKRRGRHTPGCTRVQSLDEEACDCGLDAVMRGEAGA